MIDWRVLQKLAWGRSEDLRKQFDTIKTITLILSLSALLTTCNQNYYISSNNEAQLAIAISTEYNKNYDWFADHDKFIPVITGMAPELNSASENVRQDRIRILNYAAYIAKLAIDGKVAQTYLSDDLNCLIVSLAQMTVYPKNTPPIGTQFAILRDYKFKFHAQCVQSGVQF